jgi:cytochrome c
MRALLRLLAVTTLVLGVAQVGAARAAADHGTPDEAKAMAEKAAALVQTEGLDKAITSFAAADGGFRDRDLYVFVWTTEGKCLFNAGSPSLIGKILIDLKDGEGIPIVRNIIAVQDHGWIFYNWPNPLTHKVDPKTAYIVKVGDMRVGVGAYK